MAYYYYDFYGDRPHVSVAARRERAARDLALVKKKGRHVSPIVIEGRTIAETFWGEAWCDNLERYSDFASRLPRGRSYVRHGSVIDLQIAPGRVTALVSGSSMYDVQVTIAPVARTRWRAICRDCSGAIDSLVELLQGRFSQGVMTRLCEDESGLFPSPKEISFTCSCPDWASMCKHVAAVLYGIGARLDHEPELLFKLRSVDQRELIARAGTTLSKAGKERSSAKVLESDDLSAIFGIEIAPSIRSKRAGSTVTKESQMGAEPGKPSRQRTDASMLGKPTSTERARKPHVTAAMRRAVSVRMKKYWAERRALLKKK